MIAINVKIDPCSNEELEKAADADIKKFAEYFCETLKNDSLSGPERAIIKTYIWWKTHPEVDRG